MSVLVLAVLAACSGAALAVAVLRLGAPRPVSATSGDRPVSRLVRSVGPARIATVAAVAGAVWVLTGWIAGAAIGAMAAALAPTVLGGKGRRHAALARTEAVATWTEMVRDTIAAAAGLEGAVVATAPLAPEPIRPEVAALVRRLEHQGLPAALAAFGEEVADPSADLVVAGLTLATRTQASDLTGLLSRLAESIRAEAAMRGRVEVGRTRVRTAASIIAATVVATAAVLVVLARPYLHAYDSPGGQLVLVVVGALFALGGFLLQRMADVEVPERFTARQGVRS
ncbi:MAG TPA: hypothetical protein VFJ85_15290 [Acidimicrobiales bacterium]|nr:hypothetical protein [Acidimicrobiales bacterium]